ncbi:nuclear receptor ROR-alpha A-like isoform X3, partial [Scomber scombrus]
DPSWIPEAADISSADLTPATCSTEIPPLDPAELGAGIVELLAKRKSVIEEADDEKPGFNPPPNGADSSSSSSSSSGCQQHFLSAKQLLTAEKESFLFLGVLYIFIFIFYIGAWMESSPQDSAASDPGRSCSEPGTPVTETPPSLETLRGGEHLTPARRHSSSGSSSSSKGVQPDRRYQLAAKDSPPLVFIFFIIFFFFSSESGTVIFEQPVDR